MLATPGAPAVIQTAVHPDKHKPSRSRYVAKKPTPDEFLANIKDATRASINFLKTDLETALTFSGIALSTEDPSKRDRMRQNARTAYDTVIRLVKRVDLSADDARILSDYLERLKSDLRALGEDIS